VTSDSERRRGRGESSVVERRPRRMREVVAETEAEGGADGDARQLPDTGW
jgi:hypothetical protein